MTYKKKLIEVALPLVAISDAAAREKSIRLGHPTNLHMWFARRPHAAARAVLLAQLIDDPLSSPNKFPTAEAQHDERNRIFDLISRFVRWENSNDNELISEVRTLLEDSSEGELPSIIDPFSGGGTIALEAQRLGLEVYARDLNPVAVLISKAVVEIPPRFRGYPAVYTHNQHAESFPISDTEYAGLVADIEFYGKWMRDQAKDRIGHLYAGLDGVPDESVVSWTWARTVPSPDPSWNGRVPLVRSWVLRRAKRNVTIQV